MDLFCTFALVMATCFCVSAYPTQDLDLQVLNGIMSRLKHDDNKVRQLGLSELVPYYLW
jgi:hypothetical protein